MKAFISNLETFTRTTLTRSKRALPWFAANPLDSFYRSEILTLVIKLCSDRRHRNLSLMCRCPPTRSVMSTNATH